MNSFWLFRSDLRILESYHQYTSLEEFKKHCWDFYLLQGIYFLENNYFDEVIIWRLQPKIKQKEIVFNINGKRFIQRWVDNFNEIVKYPKADISFFRGGFKEYDILTQQHSKHLGLKLYLSAGIRILPQWKGIYDYILIESEREFNIVNNCIPFYKTANPLIFKPLNLQKKYDICWPCNWTQERYKGQESFIKMVSNSTYLKKLKIIHIGNQPLKGQNMCKKYKVENIEFIGHTNRESLNVYLNQSKLGLVTSNLTDGCPRISTEILMSGTPLVISETTRLLSLYKQSEGVSETTEITMSYGILRILTNLSYAQNCINIKIKNEISFDKLCKKNIENWQKL